MLLQQLFHRQTQKLLVYNIRGDVALATHVFFVFFKHFVTAEPSV